MITLGIAITVDEDWWDVKGAVKNLNAADVNPNPFKAERSPLQDLRNFSGNPKYIRIDPAHTFAIDGIGKNYCASAIVQLMLMGWFGGGKNEARFENAYARFMAYVDARGKTTSIHEFSYKTFKLPVGSLPVYDLLAIHL